MGSPLPCGARASHCSGFSCCRAWAPGMQTSVVVARGLRSCGSQAIERRLSSCGARASLLCGMWDLRPGPGLEPVSPAVAGGFLTTAPPGKALTPSFNQLASFSFLKSLSKIRSFLLLYHASSWLLPNSFPSLPHML